MSMIYAGAIKARNSRWLPLVALLALLSGVLMSCDPWEGQ